MKKLIFFPISVLFMELVLHFASGIPADSFDYVGVLFSSAAFGLFLTFFAGISKNNKVNKWVGFGLLELVTLFFCITFFTNHSYQVFMSLGDIIDGAEGVMGGFADRIVAIAVFGFPIIVLFHVPVALYFFLPKFHIDYRKLNRGQLVVLPFATILLVLLAYFGCTYNENYKEMFTVEYQYDSAVRLFGVMPAFVKDMRNSALEEDEFVDFDDSDFELAELNVGEETAANTAEKSTMESDDAANTADKNTPESDDAANTADKSTPENADAANTADKNTTENNEATQNENVTYEPNVMNLDFDELIANAPSKDVAKVHEYVSSVTPSMKNQYTGLFAGKNLILITAEAFSSEIIDPNKTPTLYRLAHQGIYFEDYYQPAWGGSTSTGEYSNLMGIVPTNGVKSIKDTIGHNLYLTMGNQLKRLGYFSRAYHNGEYTYYGRNTTHENFGYEKFIAMGNGLEQKVKKRWPASDYDMMWATVDDYISNQPFSVYYMTVSGHCLYSNKDNSMSAKNKDKVANMDASNTIKAYYAANYELEFALEYLVNRLEYEGISDDTVIVLGTDHYPYGLEKSTTWGNTEDYLHELYGYDVNNNMQRDHSALIIWSGCLEKMEPIVISDPTYSLDIVPTLSNLFGLDYDSRLLVGRDVLSDSEAIVLWGDYDWKTRYGYYDASASTFYPTPAGEELSADQDALSEYIKRIKALVKNKISFSKSVNKYDYYNVVFQNYTPAQ